MKPSEALKQQLIAHGWTYKGDCNCGGMRTHKYETETKDGQYKLRIRATHLLISRPGVRFTKLPISEIKTIIDEVKPVTTQDTATPQA